ncbi:MAG: hypothetical protein AAGJ40_09085 [Planctomycetota bacterium]
MGRPRGPQVTITCPICGTQRSFPPSKAAGKKYCSRPCRDEGLARVTAWSELLSSDGVLYRLPTGSDPNGRGVIVGDQVLVTTPKGWRELQIEHARLGGYRITGRKPVDDQTVLESLR